MPTPAGYERSKFLLIGPRSVMPCGSTASAEVMPVYSSSPGGGALPISFCLSSGAVPTSVFTQSTGAFCARKGAAHTRRRQAKVPIQNLIEHLDAKIGCLIQAMLSPDLGPKYGFQLCRRNLFRGKSRSDRE